MEADEFPMLAQFAAGYLHEDFALEHKTAAGARDAFWRDASAAERKAFIEELERFRARWEAQPWSEVRAAFAALGGAWAPASRAALLGLLDPSAAAAGTTRPRRQRR